MKHTFYAGETTLVDQLRHALPGNPKVTLYTSRTLSIMGNKDEATRKLKLKGVAVGNTGLIFTFEGNIRHILESGEQISIITTKEPKGRYERRTYLARVSFIDSEGAHTVITLK